jgi:hypothetical protein
MEAIPQISVVSDLEIQENRAIFAVLLKKTIKIR